MVVEGHCQCPLLMPVLVYEAFSPGWIRPPRKSSVDHLLRERVWASVRLYSYVVSGASQGRGCGGCVAGDADSERSVSILTSPLCNPESVPVSARLGLPWSSCLSITLSTEDLDWWWEETAIGYRCHGINVLANDYF